MIHYQLLCKRDHSFDGWFRSGGDFDRQSRDGLLTCPVCGVADVRKAMMAPAVRRSRRDGDAPATLSRSAPGDAYEGAGGASGASGASPRAAAEMGSDGSTGAEAPSTPVATTEGMSPAAAQRMRELLGELRRHVEQNADYVGGDFPEEARRIHHGEAKRRSIYGEASPEEARNLVDEGVEVHAIPWFRRNEN